MSRRKRHQPSTLESIGLAAKAGSQLDSQAVADVGLVFSRLVTEGRGTAAELVKEASDPSSPAHPHFEWDDQRAAHQHRLQQARGYIRALVVVNPALSPTPVRAFWPVSRGSGRYKRIETIVEDEDLFKALLDRAKHDMDIWVARYHNLLDIAEAKGLVDESFGKVKKTGS